MRVALARRGVASGSAMCNRCLAQDTLDRVSLIVLVAAGLALFGWFLSTANDDGSGVAGALKKALSAGSSLPSDTLLPSERDGVDPAVGGVGADVGGCKCADDTFGENCAGDFYRSVEYLPASPAALRKCDENQPGATFQARALRTQLDRLQKPAQCRDDSPGAMPYRQTMTYRLYRIPEISNMTDAMRMAIMSLADAHVAGYAMQYFPRRQLSAGHADETIGKDPVHLSSHNPGWQGSFAKQFCNKGFGLPVGLACFFENTSPCYGEKAFADTNVEPAAVLQPPLGISVDNVPTPFDRRGVHWYATQLAGFLWRPNPRVEQIAEQYIKEVGLGQLVGGTKGLGLRRGRSRRKDNKGVIGLYVPTDIDCTEFQHNKAGGCFSFPEYMNYVERMRRRYGATKVLLVAENHRAIVATADDKYKAFEFHFAGSQKFVETSGEPDDVHRPTHVGANFAEIGLKHLQEKNKGVPLGVPMPTADLTLTQVLRLELLSRCDYLVAPFGHSASTLAYQLMAYRKGYWPPFASVDNLPIGRGGMRYEVRKVAVLDESDRKQYEIAYKREEALALLRQKGDGRGWGCRPEYRGDKRLCPRYKEAKAWDDQVARLEEEAGRRVVHVTPPTKQAVAALGSPLR